MSPSSPLYDIDEAAAYLKLRPGTFRNWLSAKRLGYVKVGRLTRIPKLELDRFLAAHTIQASGGRFIMNLFKRCPCPQPSQCDHPYWYRFRLHGEECRRSTRSANQTQAQRIAAVRQAAVLEGREGIRRDRGVKLSEHIKAYVAYTKKTNRTSYKDADVLARFLEVVSDRRLKEISPFHLERWKSSRAKDVSQSTVNRELNIVRGCFSRAVEWDRLGKSPARSVKPYRVDNVRLRLLTDVEVTRLLSDEATDTAFTTAAEKENGPGSVLRSCLTCD